MGAIEFFIWAVRQALDIHPVLLVIFFVIFVYALFRLFSLITRSAIVGVIAAGFPVFLHMIGYPTDLSFSTLAMYGAIGFFGHLAYASVMSFFRTGRTFFRLGRKLAGGPKPRVKKIVVKEKRKE